MNRSRIACAMSVTESLSCHTVKKMKYAPSRSSTWEWYLFSQLPLLPSITAISCAERHPSGTSCGGGRGSSKDESNAAM
jgi:hypothetical protein